MEQLTKMKSIKETNKALLSLMEQLKLVIRHQEKKFRRRMFSQMVKKCPLDLVNMKTAAHRIGILKASRFSCSPEVQS